VRISCRSDSMLNPKVTIIHRYLQEKKKYLGGEQFRDLKRQALSVLSTGIVLSVALRKSVRKVTRDRQSSNGNLRSVSARARAVALTYRSQHPVADVARIILNSYQHANYAFSANIYRSVGPHVPVAQTFPGGLYGYRESSECTESNG
jgi:hypothetical protein